MALDALQIHSHVLHACLGDTSRSATGFVHQAPMHGSLKHAVHVMHHIQAPYQTNLTMQLKP
jgi:hypothetical protein